MADQSRIIGEELSGTVREIPRQCRRTRARSCAVAQLRRCVSKPTTARAGAMPWTNVRRDLLCRI